VSRRQFETRIRRRRNRLIKLNPLAALLLLAVPLPAIAAEVSCPDLAQAAQVKAACKASCE